MQPKINNHEKSKFSLSTCSLTPPTNKIILNPPTNSTTTNSHDAITHTAIADTGANGTYLTKGAGSQLLDLQIARQPLTVNLPDGTIATSTHTGLLPITSLPMAARRAHVFPTFQQSLVAIAPICDANFKVVYDKATVTILDADSQPVLSGTRNTSSNPNALWEIDITNPSHSQGHTTPHTASHVYPSNLLTTQQRLTAWYHAAMGSPTIPTFHHAIASEWIRLPGLTPSMIKNFVLPAATHYGHLRQHRQGLDSTQSPLPSSDSTPRPSSTSQPSEAEEDYIFTSTHPLRDITDLNLHNDLTGAFTPTSHNGNAYILIMFSPAHNYIHVEPQRSRSAADFIRSYRAGLNFWSKRATNLSTLRVDNELPLSLRNFITTQHPSINIDLCPPNSHRANKAERAIQTFKDHFIATLAAVDPSFPPNLWDLLLPQAELTLNLMRASTVSPSISAWQQLHQQPYHYDLHPFAPPGIRIISHIKPGPSRPTWGPHGAAGFYIGPALDHHRCYRVHITSTKRCRITDTIAWLPTPTLITPPPTLNEFFTNSCSQLQQFLDMNNSPAITAQVKSLLDATTHAHHILFPPRTTPQPLTIIPETTPAQHPQQINVNPPAINPPLPVNM
jgi:hypothetical protein